MEDNAIYDRPEIDGEDEEMKEEIDTDSKLKLMTNADDNKDFCENTLNLTNGSFRSHHIRKS